MVKKFLVACLFVLLSQADTKIAQETFFCCTNKDDVGAVTNNIIAMMKEGEAVSAFKYMVNKQCDMIAKGDKFKIVDSSFSLVKVLFLRNGAELWCPRELDK